LFKLEFFQPEKIRHRLFNLSSAFVGADIDTLVLGPRDVNRDDFFENLYEILIKRPEITKITVRNHLTLINFAYVP